MSQIIKSGLLKVTGSFTATLCATLVSMVFTFSAQAACSGFKNFATINEIHKSGNNTRFLEVKILDSNITSSTYDNWNISTCTIVGCTSISLSDANDADLPYIVVEKPELPDRNRIPLGDGTGEGGDVILTDASGNTIDYLSVNDFRNQWWGWNNQYDSSCAPAFDWEHPGTNTHTIAREPDGTGDWSDNAGNSGGTSESATNDNDPAPDGGTVPVLAVADVTVTAGDTASFVVTLTDTPKPYDVTFAYTTLDNTAIAGTDYTSITGTETIAAGASQTTIDVTTLAGSAGAVSYAFFISSPVSATILNHVAVGNIDAGAGLDHFVISHDGLGIHCLAETISVVATNTDSSTDTGYTGTISLDTQSGKGTWTLDTGTGSFSDSTADDGLATYSFNATDNGVVTFNLDYSNGTASIDIDVFEGTVRDDDTEGSLVFSPSGFTVTSSPLAVPFAGVVNTAIAAQTAAKDFTLYLAAYGQTPTNATCGIIESYTGNQSLKFWSGYSSPVSGTLPVTVNGGNVSITEAGSANQTVNFNNGQASITVNYPDAGQIDLQMKDDSVGNPDLPGGITGASQTITSVPAGLCVDSTDLNAGCASGDESCSAFVAAGASFNLGVKAVAWQVDGDTDFCAGNATTPNFQLSTIALSQNLVAPATGSAGNLGVTSFDMQAADNGDHNVSQSVSEVGVFTFTATPPAYFGETIAVSSSANIGRFYPNHFTTAITAGSFANMCTTGTAFTYIGQSFGYLGSPTVNATAKNLAGTTTTNYTGVWATLTTGGVSLTYPSEDVAQNDQTASALIAVTSTEGSASRTDNGDGSLTFTLGGSTSDSFAYERKAGQVAPFVSNLVVELTSVSDGEASASDLGTPKSINPAGNLQRFGRGNALDVNGTMSLSGDNLTMTVGSWFYSGTGNWTLNTDDSCSSYTYTKTDTGITTTIPPADASPKSLANGLGNLTLTISANAPNGGTSVIDTVWDSWLQYDTDGIDQLLDGNNYDDNPTGTATFGIFRGNDRYLYWREGP